VTDFFSFVGLPRKLTIDAQDLEQRYRALSRQFHPDYFYNAPAADRRQSLERSSYLNDAYRTLRHPISRTEYLLALEGFAAATAEAAARHVPPALLEEVFALNEELDEIRALKAGGAPAAQWRGALESAKKRIENRRDYHEHQLRDLSRRWDAVVDRAAPDPDRRVVLEALRDRMLERNYINNLLAGMERDLAE